MLPRRHTHTQTKWDSVIPNRLLSTVKKQTTAPTLNVNVLRRRTRRRRRSREAAGREKNKANEPKKERQGRGFLMLVAILVEN